MSISIEKYNETYQERWDDFVLNKSLNGTFMQTRNFLNYHPDGKFIDASILFVNSGNIIAVIPACDTVDEGKRTFFSHKGSTFGGIVIGKDYYSISNAEEIFCCLEQYLKEEKYEKVLFRNTADLFCEKDMALLDYEFFKAGYEQYNELSFYVDCKKLTGDVASIMSSTRRRGYRSAVKNNLRFEQLRSDEQITDFYHILEENLKKFDTTPVHSLDEIFDLKNNRLRDGIDFYGIYSADKLIAGSMIFKYSKRVFHAQYFAVLPEEQRLFPMNMLDHHLIETARELGFDYFSFGISTDNRGKNLNLGLALFKEGFGSEYSVNRSYIKNF